VERQHLHRNGDGTLKTRVNYPVGFSAWNLSLADFNNDGKIDLAASAAVRWHSC
jgi:hypothetical protein